MSRIVSPEEFASIFVRVAKGKEATISEAWDGPSAKYSLLLLDQEDGVLPSVAKELALDYRREHWTVDAIMFEKRDADNFPEDWGMAEVLTLAIEHENDGNDSHYEMHKLTLYNSPLKVLITYPAADSSEKLLRTYSDILRRADAFDDFSTRRRHLVIFGSKSGGIVRWESYVYRAGEFAPVEDPSP